LSPDEPPQTLGDLIDVRRAHLVVIHDVWTGYNPHSPVARIWNLRRGSSGEFVGEGRFSTSSVAERTVEVALDATKATQFLDAVAKAIITSGEYEPLVTHTDDFPHIEVAFHVPVADLWRRQGVALLFTESQGRFHSPWGACIGGKRGVVPGPEIGRALSKLDKALKGGTLDRMMEEADRR
jgi:hypothetical protein